MRFYIEERPDPPEPCFVLMLGEALAKAGPYIGPRGGKWADPKHTIAWDEKKHGKGRQMSLFGKKPEAPKAEEPAPKAVIPAKPTDAEHQARVDAYNEKQEAKKERYRDKAEKLRTEAASRFKAGDLREEVSGIPFGQPILVGHHSEKRHRRAIDRANANIGKGIEAQKKAEHYEAKAKGMGRAGISSDDPEAVVKLKKKIAIEEKKRDDYKQVNKLLRKKDMTPEKLATEMGWKIETAKKVMEPGLAGRKGFPSYILTNMGANIRRMKQRVDLLKEAEAIPEAAPVVGKGYRVEESKEDNRIRFYFDEKPSREVTKKMKSAGFRWSPTQGAWQRHLNNAGRYAAERMAKELFPDEGTIEDDEDEGITPLAQKINRVTELMDKEYPDLTDMEARSLLRRMVDAQAGRPGSDLDKVIAEAEALLKASDAQMEHFVFIDPLLKAGPFIGPRGGKWQDPRLTIPWKPEALPGKGKEPQQWGKLPPGKTAKEHVQIAHEFLRKHKAALPEAKASISELAKGAKVKGRTKTLQSALGKMVKKPKYKTADMLQDGTGLRAVHKTIKEVQATVAAIKAKYKVIDEDDYITKPQGNYRSHHLIIEGPGGLAMEIQIRTGNQDVFADWAHNVYKPVTAEQAKHRADPEVATYEKGMADYMWAADNERNPPPPERPPCTLVVSQAFGCL